MATPNEKLASSLEILKSLQDQGLSIFQVSTQPTLTRVHRERLQKTGFIQPIINGWYIISNPADNAGDSTRWYAHMDGFVAAYATSRFGNRWQVPAELSLLKHSGSMSVNRQVQLHAPSANNQPLALPHGCSLFMYRVKPESLAPGRLPDASGLLLMPLPDALIQVSPSFFHTHELAAHIAARRVDISQLIAQLLDGGHSVVAGRMAGMLRAVGREEDASRVLSTMKAAGYAVSETNPFIRPLTLLPGARTESPYVQRIRAMWAAMREPVIKRLASVPRQHQPTKEALLGDISARYVADAYHSLSIEGYQVSAELIEKVRSGDWSPLTKPEDKQAMNAMAAKGYAEAHIRVKELIGQVMEQKESPAAALLRDFPDWYVALFSPSVTAGILKASDLAGYRNHPIYIRNALHVPPAPEGVRDCMPALMDLLQTEEHPGVRAILGSFFFVFIHPYPDGNGRISRFLMNFMLTTGDYPWTIVTVQSRSAYLAALEQASTYQNIEPLADLICSLLESQAAQPLERITQRPESGPWTVPTS